MFQNLLTSTENSFSCYGQKLTKKKKINSLLVFLLNIECWSKIGTRRGSVVIFRRESVIWNYLIVSFMRREN